MNGSHANPLSIAWRNTSLTSCAYDVYSHKSGAFGVSFDLSNTDGRGVCLHAAFDSISGQYALHVDQITIFKLKDGADGENGQSPLAGYLTNESHTVAADAAGAIMGDRDRLRSCCG